MRKAFPFLGRRPTTPPVYPGNAAFTSPGGYQFTVPRYNTLYVDVKGPGGGGGATGHVVNSHGQPGNPASKFNSETPVIGNPGGGGQSVVGAVSGAHGAPGTASGGDINTTGGGANGGASHDTFGGFGGDGGKGGRAEKTWNRGDPGAPAPGQIIDVTVGAGGAGGSTNLGTGGSGQHGSVSITWA